MGGFFTTKLMGDLTSKSRETHTSITQTQTITTSSAATVNIRGSFNQWLSSMNLAMNQKNILGGELEPCSFDPLTGWFRDGYCRQDDRDHGSHTVCAEVTHAFLEYTKGQGNDLSAPRGGFPGLKPGDMWCLCAARWRQAMLAGSAPRVVQAATHQAALQVNSLEEMARQDDSCTGSA